MGSTLTAVPSVGNTQHAYSMCIRVLKEDSQSPPNRSSAAMYLLHGHNAGAGQQPSDQISNIEACGRRSRTEMI